MKNILLAFAMVALLTSCDKGKEELNSVIKEMADAKEKKDPNFKYFNDKYQVNQREEW